MRRGSKRGRRQGRIRKRYSGLPLHFLLMMEEGMNIRELSRAEQSARDRKRFRSWARKGFPARHTPTRIIPEQYSKPHQFIAWKALGYPDPEEG